MDDRPYAISTIVSTPLRDVRPDYMPHRMPAPAPTLAFPTPADRNFAPRHSPAGAPGPAFPSPAGGNFAPRHPPAGAHGPPGVPAPAGGNFASRHPPAGAPPLAGVPTSAGGNIAHRNPPTAARNAGNIVMPVEEPIDPCGECFAAGKGKPMYDEHEIALVIKRPKRPSACSTYADPETLRTLFTWEPRDGRPSSAKPQTLTCRSVRSRGSWRDAPLVSDDICSGAARYLHVRTTQVKRMSERSTAASSRVSNSPASAFTDATLARFGPHIAEFHEWTVTQPTRLTADYWIDSCFYRCPPCAR
eukprot:GEMP01029809.1.p1 GENE.GEMP01029809.1~~GEMP01029809.1.p1  ORF type:complete len:303 (-),score=59.07 GEMP01029809.1:1239-2147(-)